MALVEFSSDWELINICCDLSSILRKQRWKVYEPSEGKPEFVARMFHGES